MKWLALFLFCVQAKWISSCVFDKVEKIDGHIYETTHVDVNQCLAICYRDKNCVGILHVTEKNECDLIDRQESMNLFYCTGIIPASCYILQRDEVDSACLRYLNFLV